MLPDREFKTEMLTTKLIHYDMPGANTRTTKQAKKVMLAALKESLGVISTAAKLARLERKTHYLWMDKDPSYKEAVENIVNTAIDFAETSLLTQIKENNTTATIFYLKTKGKHRGYIDTNTNVTINHNHMEKYSEAELLAIINEKPVETPKSLQPILKLQTSKLKKFKI